jgi:hypothetical protein
VAGLLESDVRDVRVDVPGGVRIGLAGNGLALNREILEVDARDVNGR